MNKKSFMKTSGAMGAYTYTQTTEAMKAKGPATAAEEYVLEHAKTISFDRRTKAGKMVNRLMSEEPANEKEV